MEQISVKSLSGAIAGLNQSFPPYKGMHLENLGMMLYLLPRGSGIDNGVKLTNNDPEKIIFTFGFHHMDENGSYDGWTEHNLIITPSLQYGYRIRITGKDKNRIKEYLYDLFTELFTN